MAIFTLEDKALPIRVDESVVDDQRENGMN